MPDCQPPAKPGRPRDARTDDAVLEAALALLAEGGYARLTMEAVAAAAGTTKPTLYRRWPCKDQLVVAALSRFQLADAPVPTGDTRADLARILEDFRGKLLRPHGMAMVGTILAEERHLPGLIAQFRERIVRPRREGLLAILEAARGRGEIAPEADTEAMANALVGAFYAHYLAHGTIPEDLPRRLVALLLPAR